MSLRTELTNLAAAAGTIQSFLVSCDSLNNLGEVAGMQELKAVAIKELLNINDRMDQLLLEIPSA